EGAWAVGQDVLGIRALHRVLDVLAGDGRAVLELDVGLEVVGPGQAVVADLPQACGEVRRELVAARTGHGLVSHQTTAVKADHVPLERVVGVAGVGWLGVAAVVEDERPALMVGLIADRFDRAAVPGCLRRVSSTTAAAAGARSHPKRCRHAGRSERYCSSCHLNALPPALV